MMAAWLECFTLALREQRSAPHAGCVSGTSRCGPNIPLCNGYVQTAAVNGVRTETADVARGSGSEMRLCVHRSCALAWCEWAQEPTFVRAGQKPASGSKLR